MGIDFSSLYWIKNPTLADIKQDPFTFLASLKAPTIIDVDGKNNERWRVISTLIHGNEPSGLIATHRWLEESIKKNLTPEVNMRFILASVEAAQLLPLLSHRYLPNGLDLNRCFGSYKQTGYYKRATTLENAIRQVNPEAVIDLHNTSGVGPAFSVSPKESADELSLTSLFSQSMIVSTMALGALMEQDFGCPVITIECGGRSDQQSHEVAYQGIAQLASNQNISTCHHLNVVEVVEQPLRVKLKNGVSLSYSNNPIAPSNGVVLKAYIEQLNTGITCVGRVLGWLDKQGLNNLEMIDRHGDNVIAEYFEDQAGALTSRHNLRLFMATSNRDIAMSDCLFYAVKSKSSHQPIG